MKGEKKVIKKIQEENPELKQMNHFSEWSSREGSLPNLYKKMLMRALHAKPPYIRLLASNFYHMRFPLTKSEIEVQDKHGAIRSPIKEFTLEKIKEYCENGCIDELMEIYRNYDTLPEEILQIIKKTLDEYLKDFPDSKEHANPVYLMQIFSGKRNDEFDERIQKRALEIIDCAELSILESIEDHRIPKFARERFYSRVKRSRKMWQFPL